MSESDSLSSPGGGRRPPWSEFRAALDAVGFRPTKGLGQNFLIDPNAARSIALDSRVGAGDRVLEVGAGCGFLSVQLVALGVQLLAVEIDPRLAQVARRLLGEVPGLHWVLGDVLASKHRLAPAVAEALPERGDWHLVSNLPYSVSAPVLAVLARLENPPRSMTVLVQEEMAARVAARPGEDAWGTLSARLALRYRCRAGRPVGSQLFWPRPRVASRVVHLDLDPSGGPPSADLEPYDRVVELLFQQRRKQLAGVLAGPLRGRAEALALLGALGIDPRGRPEDLGPPQLLALSRASPWRDSLARNEDPNEGPPPG